MQSNEPEIVLDANGNPINPTDLLANDLKNTNINNETESKHSYASNFITFFYLNSSFIFESNTNKVY